MYELSEEKANNYESQITSNLKKAGTIENPTEPIAVILGVHQEIRVITKDSADEDITTGVREELKKIISGSSERVIEGIAGLIENGLRKVLGVEKGEEAFESSYYIATEGLSVVRLDLMYWSRHISAASVAEYAEKSLLCVVVKSSIDMSKLSFIAFLSAYQRQLAKCDFSVEELEEELQKAKEIYALFNPGGMV